MRMISVHAALRWRDKMCQSRRWDTADTRLTCSYVTRRCQPTATAVGYLSPSSDRHEPVLLSQSQEGLWIALGADFLGQDAGDIGHRLDRPVGMQEQHPVAPGEHVLDG